MNIDDKKLIILDFNGTIVNTPFKDKQPLHLLPGRVEKIAKLQVGGKEVVIASNQGGVAFGILTESDAYHLVWSIAETLGIEKIEVAVGHPKPKPGYEWYASWEYLVMRKPSPGMIFRLKDRCRVKLDQILFVGDLPEDELAAKCAGVDFTWADNLFGDECD